MGRFIESWDDFAAGAADDTGTAPALRSYGLAGDPVSALRDPAFLQDLREHFRDRGIDVGTWSEEMLVDRFYSDRNWADLNTVSAARDAYRAHTSEDDARLRAASLQRVWQELPNVFQDGGRGFGGAADIAGAILADPINAVGGLAAKPVAAGATRAALAAGRSASEAGRAGVKAGITRGAASEAAVSGGAEAGFDALTQSRDLGLGLQDEFSYGRLAGSTALGATIGGAAGAAFGIPGALAGRTEGARQVDTMRRVGIPDDEIGALSSREASRAMSDPYALGEMVAGSPGRAARNPTPEEVLEAEAAAQREALARQVEDEADADTIAQTKEELARLQARLAELEKDTDAPASPADPAAAVAAATRAAKSGKAKPKGEAAPAEPAAEASEAPTADAEAVAEAPAISITGTARNRAEKLGIDVSKITGTGKNGQIVARDVMQAKKALAKTSPQDVSDQADQAPGQAADQEPANAPEKPARQRAKIPAHLRKEALAKGIDPDAAAAGARTKKGQAKEVRRAIRGRDPVRKQDDYVTRLRSAVARAMDLANEAEADTIEEVKAIVGELARDTEFAEFGDDLAAYLDLMMTKAHERGLLFDEQPEVVDLPELTGAQIKRAREIAKALRASEPDLTNEAVIKLAEDKVRREAGMSVGKSLTRSSGDRAVKAGMFEGAGRNPNGRIQTFMRRSAAISKGSDYGIGGDVEYPMAHNFDMEAAILKAQEPGAEDIQPFIATGKEIVRRVGQKKGTVPKGTMLYADGRTNAAYDSRDMILYLRGEKPGEQAAPAPQAEAPTPAERPAAKVMKAAKGNPAKLKKILDAKAKGEDAPDLIPVTQGEKLLIIRNRETGEVRMMTPRQAADGKTMSDLLGKSPAAKWEANYAPAETRTGYQAELRKLWDRLEPDPEAAKVTPDVTAEDAFTPDGPPPARFEDVARRKTPEITEEEADELALLFKSDREMRMALRGKSLDVRTLMYHLHLAEMTPWGKRHMPDVVRGIAAGRALLARTVPEGVVMPAATRDEAVQTLRNILNRYSPEEAIEAERLIRGLGGDQNRAPRVVESRNGSRLNTDYVGDGEEFLRLDPSQRATNPRIATLYHEVAHWAYFNILTDADRAEFWRAMQKYDGQPDALTDRLARRNGEVYETREGPKTSRTNTGYSPQELFAHQFEIWASRRPGTLLGEESYWQRVGNYVKAIFDRYVRGVQIDPDLEPLFAKILPDAEQPRARMETSRQPTTLEGEHNYKRILELRMLRDDLEDAIERGSDEGTVQAALEFARFLGSIGQSKDKGTGAFMPTRGLLKMIHQRRRDIAAILRIKTQDGEFKDTAGELDAIISGDDMIEAADTLADFWINGHGGKYVPEDGPASNNLEATSLRALADMLYNAMEQRYMRAEGGRRPPGEKPASARERLERAKDEKGRVRTGSKTATKAKKKAARIDTATKRAAVNDAKTSPAKRVTKPDTGAGSGKPLEDMSETELLAEFRATRGTPRGAAAARRIVEWVNAQPEFGDGEIDNDMLSLSNSELETAFLDALYDGDAARITAAASLMAARRDGFHLPPHTSEIIDAVEIERADRMGVPDQDSIPAAARATVREVLGYMTHRDADVQHTLRTMAYRMFNLMGRTARGAIEEANMMTAGDVARLAGVEPSQAGSAVFADFRAPEFQALRSDLRRMAIGLTKGKSDPLDAMHEIGHVLLRSGAMPAEEIDAITEGFRIAKGSVKERIEKLYGGKYANRDEPERTRLLAEEWFAEELARYMAERTARGDVYAQLVDGDFQSVELRGAFDRAIDRAVEYVAYIVNGLMGRRDLRQTFRRLTFYGDMLGRPSKAPLSAKRTHVPASMAASTARDTLMASPKARVEKVRGFVAGGYGAENGMPITFYHGTPHGSAFDRKANPDMAVKMSPNGDYGPGFYVAEDPRPADEVYSRRPTPESMRAMIEAQNPDMPEMEREDVIDDLIRLHSLRRTITELRIDYADRMMAADQADEVTAYLAVEDMGSLADEIVDLHALEREMSAEMAELGAVVEPLVAPVYVRLLRPADFRRGATIAPDAPLARELADRLGVAVEQELDGPAFYKALVGRLAGRAGYTPSSAKVAINRALREAGYDGMLTTHINSISIEGGTEIEGLGTLGAQRVQYTAPVVFDAKQVKHINASDFDASDDRLYHRKREDELPREVNSTLAMGMMDGLIDSPSQVLTSSIADTVERAGGSPRLGGALMAMMKGRKPSPREQQALLHRGPRGWLMEQSQQMRHMGMNWLAGWYEDHFPNVQQTFAAKFLPLHKALTKLPDADGKVRGWARRASGGVGQKQPQSYRKITAALRRASGSRSEAALTVRERAVYEQIREAFRNERRELVKRGVFMGNRGEDYFPQVWSTTRIGKDAEGFKAAMAEYLQIEAAANGRAVSATEAVKFGERMYAKLIGEESDGIFIPQAGGSRNPQSDNLDFSRMIELDKYPEALAKLERYLEPDLDATLVKYFEGTARRAAHIDKMGHSSHALYDYLRVVDQGAEGIAHLLSTDKVVTKDLNTMAMGGDVEIARLKDVTRMPFHGREPQAMEFAKTLIEAHATGGSGAARRALMDVAPTDARGGVPLAYQRRADAIIGALDDYKGHKSGLQNAEFNWVEDAMRVAMRKRRSGVSHQAAVASGWARNFNSISLLGFTTLTSLTDVALPLIRSGNMQAYAKAVRKFAADPEYRDMIKGTGVAIENILHDRMMHLFGTTDGKLTNAFFNASMLTPWTDMMRGVAGAVGYEAIKAEQRRAQKYARDKTSRQYRMAMRFLTTYGLADFLPDGPRGTESLADMRLLDTDETVRKGLLKFADKAVFTPNPNDIPLWAQSPVGALIAQFKTFPLMMMRMGGHVGREAWQGNPTPLLYYSTFGPAAGMGALAVKDVVQMRGGEENREAEVRHRNILKSMGYDKEVHGDENDFLGWYFDGMLMMGGLGLVAEIAYGLADQVDNGAYGQVRTASLLGGPTVGTGFAVMPVLAGGWEAATGQNPDSNAKERSGAREIATRIPFVGGVRSAREAIVDAVAGRAEDDGGWGNSGW